MLPRRILFKLYFRWVLVELWWDSEVAKANVALAWRKKEDVTALRVVLHMSNDFRKLFNVDRLEVHGLVGQICVVDVPKVDAEIVWGEEVFSVRADTQLVYIVIVTVLELLFLNTLVTLTDNSRLWEHDLIAIHLAAVVLPVPAVFKLP